MVSENIMHIAKLEKQTFLLSWSIDESEQWPEWQDILKNAIGGTHMGNHKGIEVS